MEAKSRARAPGSAKLEPEMASTSFGPPSRRPQIQFRPLTGQRRARLPSHVVVVVVVVVIGDGGSILVQLDLQFLSVNHYRAYRPHLVGRALFAALCSK